MISNYIKNKIDDKISKMEDFFNINIVEYIEGKEREGKYSKECLDNLKRIKEGENITEELNKKVYNLRRDKRTCEEFVIDIILAWIMEDYVEEHLKNSNTLMKDFEVMKSGVDINREFLTSAQIKRTPDLRLINRKTKEEIYLEIMEDRTGFIKGSGKFNLRSGKLKHLQKEVEKDTKSFILIMDLKNKEYILYPVSGDEDLTEKPHFAYGGNPATTTHISNIKDITHKDDQIGKAIVNIVS